MNLVRMSPALALLGIFLAGCGSSGGPSLTISCISHRLPSGLQRVNVTVANSSGTAQNAALYGQALLFVKHEYPALRSRSIDGTSTGPLMIGLMVPHVPAKGSTQVLLRVQPSSPAPRLAVTAGDGKLAGTDKDSYCLIHRPPGTGTTG